MDTLSSWLGAIGLDRYASLFESHGIDLRSLPLLSESDLAELGVLLGHRRLLLRSIAALECEAADLAMASIGVADAERRQLTVLFCDLVGSTALAQRLDPETLRELMSEYQQTCGAKIKRYGGHVAQYRGDGLEVYFGWPQAHEDNAERAVRAALEIVPAVSRLASPQPLQVRIGIATGLVVVGAGGDGDASVPSAAVGETPNLAARLQGLAAPDQIVVAPATYRLLGQTFDVEDLGYHHLKGIDGPVRARRIRSLARSESRFDATRDGHYTPFVGRDREISALLSRWKQASEGAGHVVLLVGEPGIGKSRLTRVLRERVAEEPHLRLQYQCSPYHTGSAFFPIIEQLEHSAGFERNDFADRKLDKLEAVLALSAEALPVVAPLFAALLSLPSDRYSPRMLSPQKHKELTLAALVDLPVRAAAQQPVLAIWEDVHWSDPSTLETLALTVEKVRHSAILLVITVRPHFVPPWTGNPNVTLLQLKRLSKRHGTAMTDCMTGGKALPREVLAQILERTDGVPLFVEELTKTVLEAGFLRDAGDRWELSCPLPPLAIPSTLQDSLMARLDRLAPIKEVAQVGACIGREFGHELLAAAARLPEAELNAALDRLIASGLVFRHGSASEAMYSFKHALVQDAAYEGLLKSRRQQIHGHIARALENDFPDAVKARPEVLALHLTRAGSIDAALAQWIVAAGLALASTRYREALAHVDAGLAIIDRASNGQRANHEVALLDVGAGCHFALSGYASEPATALLTRAEAVLERVSDRDVLLLAIKSILLCAYFGGDTSKATALAERALALAEEMPDMDKRVATYSVVAPIFYQRCEFARARQILESLIENYKPSRPFAYARDLDAKVDACARLALICNATGYPDQALVYMHMSIDHATALAHPFSLSQALGMGSLRLADSGDYENALELSRCCIELCDSQRLPFWKGWAMVGEGGALLGLGQHKRAEARLSKAASYLAATGSGAGTGQFRMWRAIALAHLGRFDEARREADDGRERCLQSGHQMRLPRLAYARGVTETLDPDADPGAAEQWFDIALSEARDRGMRMAELSAATALARLWHQGGRSLEARELLGPLYDWFTEGFDCSGLQEARALLDELETNR